MNVQLVIILLACLWSIDCCNRSCSSHCSGNASCNHFRGPRRKGPLLQVLEGRNTTSTRRINGCVIRCTGNAICDHLIFERAAGEEGTFENDQGTVVHLKESNYLIKLPEEPCSFNTYDIDGDGIISQDELFDILGISMIPEDVSKDVDVMTDDGIITPEEFNVTVSHFVPECQHFYH